MEHIQLQTPWRRGGDWKIEVAGTYCYRCCADKSRVFACFKELGERTNDQCVYSGPLDIHAPEPMPELVRVEGCDKPSLIRWFDQLISCQLDSGNKAVIRIWHADERIARLAFNAAARVLNGEKQ